MAGTRFRDRDDAGQQLAAFLGGRGLEGAVVLGIPRGGVVPAVHVARALGGELGVIVARKLRAPSQAELAIGATTPSGDTWINEPLAREAGADEAYISREVATQVREARRREEAFGGPGVPSLAGRTVVIVDDGIATGATAIAAVRAAKRAGASTVVLAVPVGPPHTLDLLRGEADDVVSLLEEEGFFAVGQFYDEFWPVEDDEVRRILDSFARTAGNRTVVEATVPYDGVRLAVRLVLPGLRPCPAVIFVHGLGSSKESPRNVVIAERLIDAGVAAVLFDLSGHGESSAAPHEGMETYVEDLAAVSGWVGRRPEIDATGIGLSGSSLGGIVALEAVRRGRFVPRTMVLRAPPVERGAFAGLPCPVLCAAGSLDPLLAGVRREAAREPGVELAVIPGASHLFEEPGTLEAVTERTVQWFVEHLLPAGEETPPATAAL